MRNVVRSSLPGEIKRSLDVCWKEGVVAQVTLSIFDYYLIPYALLLGATPQQVGFLVAFPNLLSSVSQLMVVRAVHFAGTRRNMLVYGTGTQAMLLIPVAILPFLPIAGKIWILIAFISVFRLLGSLIGPAWGSLVSNYLPGEQRGQYMGWRSRMVGIAGILAVALWGSLLYFIRQFSQATAFLVLFSAAVAFRFISFYLVSKMVDVPVEKTPESEFTFWMFIRRFRESNFVKFIFYVTSITFSIQLAAPYFSVHMLKNLHFNYLSYMSVHLASVVAGLIAFPLWGRNADIVGNAKVLKSTSVIIPIIPVFWMFARTPVELMLVEMFSGLVMSGFTLSTTNFIYDAVSPVKRVRCLGYYNLINGGAIFLGASLGGYLAERLPPIMGYPLVTLFLISGIFRLFADLALSRHFAEVRESAQKVTSTQLYLSVAGVRPLVGENVEWDIYPQIRPPRKDLHGKRSD